MLAKGSASLSSVSVAVLAAMLSFWLANLFFVVYLARRNNWKSPWKMLVVTSVIIGPLAMLLFSGKLFCGKTETLSDVTLWPSQHFFFLFISLFRSCHSLVSKVPFIESTKQADAT